MEQNPILDENTIPETAENKPEKKKTLFTTKHTIIILIAGIAVVALVLFLCLNASASNAIRKLFLNNQKYYESVEKRAIKELAGNLSTVYGDVYLTNAEVSNQKISFEWTSQVEEMGTGMMELAAAGGYDVEWFEEAKLSGFLNVRENKVSAKLETGVNKQDVLSMDLLYDLDSREGYFRMPELSSDYLEIGMAKNWNLDAFLSQSDRAIIVDELPSKRELKKLLSRYLTVVLSQISDVKRKDGVVIKAAGIRQETIELSFVIDETVCETIKTAILKETAEDERLQKIISNMSEALVKEGKEELGYDRFLEKLEAWIDTLISAYGKDAYSVSVFVDSKGNIIGRTITDSSNKTIFSWQTPKEGENVGISISMGDIGLVGKGQETKDLFTGELELINQNGETLLCFDVVGLNVEKLFCGEIDGVVKTVLEEDILQSIGLPEQASSYLRGYTAVASVKAAKNSIKIDFSLEDRRGIYFSGVFTLKAGRGDKVTLPAQKKVTKVENTDDALAWIEDLKWDKYFKKLKKALPEACVDLLEQMLSYYF